MLIETMFYPDRFFESSRADVLHMQDGVPIPVMRYVRASRDRCFKGEAAFGYCACKKEKYYGFLGHATIDSEGKLSGFLLTPANGSEREALRDAAPGILGVMLGDKGYILGCSSIVKSGSRIPLGGLGGDLRKDRPRDGKAILRSGIGDRCLRT